MAWFFAILVCTRLDGEGHDNVTGIVLSICIMALIIIAERLGHLIEQPMNNSVFDISMYRICSVITGNLLGPRHPLAQPRESDRATVWM